MTRAANSVTATTGRAVLRLWACAFARMAALAGLATALWAATCEQQDFSVIPGPLRVSANEERWRDGLIEPIAHDPIARHALDFSASNPSAVPVEAVLLAESLVNGEPRASAHEVLQIEAGSRVQGRIPDSKLELGNALTVELQCCAVSRCLRSEVVCPQNGEPALCVDACARLDDCTELCPAEAACVEACGSDADCRSESCLSGSATPSCANYCGSDADCLATCAPSAECASRCESSAVGCVASCLDAHAQCVGESVDESVTIVPCGLCGGTGVCTLLSVAEQDFLLQSADGAVLRCAPSCGRYPAACLSECLALEGTVELRDDCVRSCAAAHRLRCDLEAPSNDPQQRVPCCFSSSCEAELDAVLKLDSVECLTDSVCGASRRCNRRGLCENRLAEEASGCSMRRLRTGASTGGLGLASVLLWMVLAWRGRRRRKTARGKRAPLLLLAGGLLTGALLSSSPAQAEPSDFRRTRSAFVIGLSAGSFLAGEMGESSQTGLGLSFAESVRSGYFGGSVRLGAAVFPTDNAGLPFDEGVQAYELALGPRVTLPTTDAFELYVWLQPEYVFCGFQSNSLVLLTGSSSRAHGVGLSVGLEWVYESLVLELSGSFAWLWPADTALLLVSLGTGFSGML